MIKVKNRFCAALLSSTILFSTVCVDYIQVQAFEWVVPSLTVGESLLWLMGLLGIAYTDGASAWRDVSPEYEQDFIGYANEHGLTYTETSTWLNDTASGKLNQLSEVWANFKEWVKSKFASSSSSSFATMDEAVQSVFPDITVSGANSSYNFSKCLYTYKLNTTTNIGLYQFFFYEDCIYTVDNNILYITASNSGHNWYQSGTINKNYTTCTLSAQTSQNSRQFDLSTFDNIYFAGFPSDILSLSPKFQLWEGLSQGESENVYNPALIPGINFAGANTEDASIPGVIDLPWGNLGDDEEERDKTYDDLVGGLDLGQEIGDLWQALQDLMGVLAVDDAGVLQPNDGGENPPTLEDAAENNKANAAFVIPGLEKLFPFCIPFDIYAFITLLVAEPVAPVFRFPVRNPATGTDEYIIVDLSEWDSIMSVIRLAEDFLFIIGMLLMARALIGGGDSA